MEREEGEKISSTGAGLLDDPWPGGSVDWNTFE